MSFLRPHPWVTEQWVPYSETLVGNARFRIRQAVDVLGYEAVLDRAHSWPRTAAVEDPNELVRFADSLEQEIRFRREEQERARREQEQRVALERLMRRNAAAWVLLDAD